MIDEALLFWRHPASARRAVVGAAERRGIGFSPIFLAAQPRGAEGKGPGSRKGAKVVGGCLEVI